MSNYINVDGYIFAIAFFLTLHTRCTRASANMSLITTVNLNIDLIFGKTYLTKLW